MYKKKSAGGAISIAVMILSKQTLRFNDKILVYLFDYIISILVDSKCKTFVTTSISVSQQSSAKSVQSALLIRQCQGEPLPGALSLSTRSIVQDRTINTSYYRNNSITVRIVRYRISTIGLFDRLLRLTLSHKIPIYKLG